MFAPPSSPDHTWIRGAINHFDFPKYFESTRRDLLRFRRSNAYRVADDLPYDPETAQVARGWHEDEDPPVRFLTESEAQSVPL
jgi:hypothetical protein